MYNLHINNTSLSINDTTPILGHVYYRYFLTFSHCCLEINNESKKSKFTGIETHIENKKEISYPLWWQETVHEKVHMNREKHVKKTKKKSMIHSGDKKTRICIYIYNNIYINGTVISDI